MLFALKKKTEINQTSTGSCFIGILNKNTKMGRGSWDGRYLSEPSSTLSWNESNLVVGWLWGL